MTLLAGRGWRRARGSLGAAAMLAAAASQLSAGVAIWGAREQRVDWSFAVHGLLGVATPMLAVVAVVSGAAAIASALGAGRRSAAVGPGAAVLVGGLVLAGLRGWRIHVDREVLASAPVHDVATDWRDPLLPTEALLRRRGAAALPVEAAPALTEGPRGGVMGRLVAEVNAATCPSARSLMVPTSSSAAYARLKAAVLGAGSRLVTDDPRRGVLEAEARAPLAYGAHADVLARVRPTGNGALVDLRSTSRYGAVDGGSNCRRVASLRAAIVQH